MNVLIPFDVAPVSERTVRTALDLLSGKENVHITAVHITDGRDSPAEIAASNIESMGAEKGVTVDGEVHIVDHSSESKPAIRDAITEIIADSDIDLVVLGYEEKSIFERVFRSDTSERVLETYKIPVLIVP